MKFTTQSGAEYEFDGYRIRRIGSYPKRGDGEWQTLVNKPIPEIGGRVLITMHSLHAYGPDDLGTLAEDVSEYTTRVTTPVTNIEED